MTKRVIGADAQAAAGRLVARADWLEVRAARSFTVSNDRRKCDARAMHLRSCAKLILSDAEMGQRMRARLREAQAFSLGWRGLAEWVTLIAGELGRPENA